MLARLNSTSLTTRSVDVHQLVADAVADAVIDLPVDMMDVSVTPDHDVRWACDASLLQIALSAIIGNVVRHAVSGRRLDITIVRASDRLVITVGDRGPGIAAHQCERLLRRFEHGASGTAGSGLGLSIATKAMTLLGGSIRLEERPVDTGLLVVLTLG
jgi:signal transduction histidine kinase